MKQFFTDREKELQDYRRGRGKDLRLKRREMLSRRTKEAPHELIVMFRLFGAHHNISEDEMLKLMRKISTIRSRKLVQNVFECAADYWEAFLEDNP